MTPESIADFSLLAAKKYLQSAVFIDDNIYNQATANPDAGDIEIRQPKSVMKVVEKGGAPSAEKAVILDSSEQSNRPFRTKDLVGSFAKHGIVCALYQPEKDFQADENSTIFNLCQTADLVILDWDFNEVGVQGARPKVLIENLIKSGNRVAPHHVRLIAIYTNTPSLQSIANSLFQHLEKIEIKPELINSPLRLQVQAGSTRVIILGKAGGVGRIESEKSFTVFEKDLADLLLREFSTMNQGILSSCALLGMAAVRQSSARILDKFHSDLDAQFLLHRALIRDSEEAFDQLPELLGDEFKAVIEDTEYRPYDLSRFVEMACAGVKVKAHASNWKQKDRPGEEVLREFLHKPNGLSEVLNGNKKAEPIVNKPNNLVGSLADMCSVADTDAHCRFAALLAIRTQYQTKHRDLGFGSIVLNRKSDKYSVCIMPPCDSIRLTADTYFPFWELGGSGKGHPIIVQCGDDKWVELAFIPGKPSKYMRLVSFAPDRTRNIVMATIDTNQRYVFKSQDGEFEWVAQLKPSHAQRMANTIGQQLSRVGLTEAEWARMVFAKE
ncbi:response regulator receiver domain [Nitrospira sp. NS4]|uniref:response regulator receiver domain n=1 Tax=Nitrospira sp. NS4 TaxID=3414498 RepID=UPI003C30D95D